MGTLNTSNKKYILLYGEPKAGKTLFQYQLQTNMSFDTSKIEATYGISYEEYSIKDTDFGIFDLSGSLKQYKMTNVVTKFVDVAGIIFILSMKDIDKIDEARESLERILSNNYLNLNLCLFVLYNKKSTEEKLDWMDKELLDNRLGLKKAVKKFKLKSYISTILNIKESKNEIIECLYKFESELRNARNDN